MSDFKLNADFLATYANRPVTWGFPDAGGLALGELTFLNKYSHLKEDGAKETWLDVCTRVIEGMFTIQKRYCQRNRLPWNAYKAQRAAQDAFERMFTFRWTPPGRGLDHMGRPIVMQLENSAPLQNCAFVSTDNLSRRNPAEPFAFLMEASMYGIGVGFDTLGADMNLPITPRDLVKPRQTYVIPDTREGWAEATRLLINSFLIPGSPAVVFDYQLIRPKGAPVSSFGGTAAGPGPLIELHEALTRLFDHAHHTTLTAELITDIFNLIGRCVVAGNIRRSAELALGRIDDPGFIDLKNATMFPLRNGATAGERGWGWLSNNSVQVSVGDDLSPIIDGIVHNGEPGVVWMDVTRSHGRLIDAPNHKDHRAKGYNPCCEQSLESYECCTLVETYLNRHTDLDDYLKTLKVAYLYAKTVTLLTTPWERTNAVMLRNRRIGTSMSGQANFVDARGINELIRWQDAGYNEIQRLDRVYSEWLGIRESIKTTSVKPSGTVSLLAGESPGCHWSPGARFYYRTMRFANNDPLLPRLKAADYRIEPDVTDPTNTSVVYFPIHSNAHRSEREVSIFEKAQLAAMAQRWWSDNSVSVTISFKPEEANLIHDLLRIYDGQFKTVSFLPLGEEGAYLQMPYTPITEEVYSAHTPRMVDLTSLYTAGAKDAEGEQFCTTDVCELPAR